MLSIATGRFRLAGQCISPRKNPSQLSLVGLQAELVSIFVHNKNGIWKGDAARQNYALALLRPLHVKRVDFLRADIAGK